MKRFRTAALAAATATALAVGSAGALAPAPAHAGVSRPIEDQRSSIAPMFELSSPSHQHQHWRFATQEDLEAQWAAAIRMGFFTPAIARIYGLELDDLTWQEREEVNKGKYEAHGSANSVLGSSLRWDTARGMPLGTALDWWIGAGVTALILAISGGALAAVSSAR